MINYKFFFESKRKKNRGNGLKIDLFITWHGREPREEQSWLVSRVQATALNESDALPPASVCRGIFLRPKRSSSWTAVSRGHYNWESYEKKENWKIFPISNFVINDKLSDWDRFLDFISFRKISPLLQFWRKGREIGMLALDSDNNLGHLVSHSSVNSFLCRVIFVIHARGAMQREGEGLPIVSSYAIIGSFELAFWRRNAWVQKARDEAKDII